MNKDLNGTALGRGRDITVPADVRPARLHKFKDRITAIRVDPTKRAIAKMVFEMSTRPGDGHGQIARSLRGNRLGTQPMNIGIEAPITSLGDDLKPDFGFGTIPLVAVGVFDVARDTKRWGMSVNGVESPLTSGLGLIMAVGPGGGMVSLPHPADGLDWVREHMVWADGVDDDDLGPCDFCGEPAAGHVILDGDLKSACSHHQEVYGPQDG